MSNDDVVHSRASRGRWHHGADLLRGAFAGAAYVAAQERLGINVGIDTYAKLQVAAERGTSAAVLKELGLEPTDQMRLGRVWTQKQADDPMRMRELAAAIEKARGG